MSEAATQSLLDQIAALGFTADVGVRRRQTLGIALQVIADGSSYEVRIDCTGPGARYEAARQLALLVGVDVDSCG